MHASLDTLNQVCTLQRHWECGGMVGGWVGGGAVPYDSGQVYLVLGWVRSVGEEGVPHGSAGAGKTLRTRLAHTKSCGEEPLSLTGWQGRVSTPPPPPPGLCRHNCRVLKQ